jgi:CIC family chloride channel protein
MWASLKQSIGIFYETQTSPALAHLWNTRQPLLWMLAFFIGTLGAFAILAFRYTIGYVQWLWIGYHAENVAITIAATKPLWIIVGGPVVGGILIGLLLIFAVPGRRAQGMADVIAARASSRANINWKDGLMSSIVSAISLGSGASAGREGPAVHIGATIASVLGTRFKLPIAAQRTLLGCGAAAAVSASFNAPIAGVMFAHEVILAHYAMSALTPTIISGVTATVITRFYLGDFPAFAIPDHTINSNWEFPAFLLLGLVCGIVASVLKISIATSDKLAHSVPMPLWARPILGGVIIGVLAFFIPEIIGVGYEATNLALREKYTLDFLFLLLAAKTAAIAITFASRFGGGIFSPSLFLGAITGAAFGIIASAALPDLASSSSTYAIVGMGAVAGAVLGAPLSTVLIVFELTGGYEITIALLLSVSIATIVSKTIFGYSYFSWQLATRGLFIDHGQHRQIAKSWQVKDFMTRLEPDEKTDLEEFVDRPKLSPEDTLEKALKVFAKGAYSRLEVLNKNKKHIGWADYTSALAEYNSALIAANEEEHR